MIRQGLQAQIQNANVLPTKFDFHKTFQQNEIIKATNELFPPDQVHSNLFDTQSKRILTNKRIWRVIKPPKMPMPPPIITAYDFKLVDPPNVPSQITPTELGAAM